MVRALLIAFVLIGCSKKTEAPKPKEAPVTAGTVSADGVRKIEIEASREGYSPERIVGKPGEKLVLVFRRTAKEECLAQVKVADGAPVDLPMDTPVEVPVTVPQSGELAFACGMGMFKGTVVADAKG